MSVTGRTYTSTRPRGLAEWRPQSKTLALLEQVSAVLLEYADYLPMTARQVLYRLVGAHGYEKSERGYERLCEVLNRARRAGLVPWTSIRDDGATVVEAPGWDDPAAFWTAVGTTARAYRRDLSQGQPVALEVWVEAAGMVPQITRVAHVYGVPVFSSGGFDSVTVKHEAALRYLERDVPTVVLHLGDHDPSGCSIVDSAADDIATFVTDYGRPGTVKFERLAVTPEQVHRYSLETSFQKVTDRRGEHMAATVQAEALAPDELAAEVTAAIEDRVDLDLLDRVRARGAVERAEVLRAIQELNR